jgi:hypothetical protein
MMVNVPSPLRTEGLHRRWVKSAAVGAGADGQGGQDLAGIGVQDNAGGRLVAHGEEDVVLRVKAETGGPAAFARGGRSGR